MKGFKCASEYWTSDELLWTFPRAFKLHERRGLSWQP